MIFKYLIFIIIGYLNGSLLFGYIIPKLLFKVDTIKDSDDHNPGAGNSFILGGVGCGIIVLLLDLLKGFLPIFVARKFLSDSYLLFSLVLIAPVIGHAFPLFTKFKKGGKCIAVSFGVLLGLFPYMAPSLLLAFWFIFFSIVVIINPHSLRTIVAFGCWLISIIFITKVLALFIGFIGISTLVILRNFKSVKNVEERKVRFAFQRN